MILVLCLLNILGSKSSQGEAELPSHIESTITPAIRSVRAHQSSGQSQDLQFIEAPNRPEPSESVKPPREASEAFRGPRARSEVFRELWMREGEGSRGSWAGERHCYQHIAH
ncbi:hypothetical protein C7974DRAFT_395862 [Boeremia exigua]|uniref:uncharacterized protein n=1 Tax=Boeremia exigua TaxID=749465 RepID=UPI001E8D7FE3|nr:uncharacterized protein C7974DRAFT_395862 [Boeremia exigua]KAH6625321.1 hypothetical protein C7974DRAFT_395862 [Boeremia exigua]